MKIKEIILEGFKSYRNRIELNSLDPQFNCITGLNGSGKSNILDAICFVLGLKSLSHVRASSFTDLIYKGGNSGVKEASVTVVFDNTDKSKSPEGYADTDTIMVVRKISRGKTRFYVNGTGMNNLNVKRMFKSVGLNIDNPETFFVQQGRITKIVNFRPSELLEMLEEAAGIGFYKEIAKDCEEVVSEKSNRLELQEDRMNSFLGTKLKILDKEAQRVQEHEQAVEQLTLQEALVWNLDVYNSRKAVYLGIKAVESTKEGLSVQEAEKLTLIQEFQKLKELPSNGTEAAVIVKKRTSEISNIKQRFLELQKHYKSSELFKNSDRDKKQTLEMRVSRSLRELQELEFKNKERGVEMEELIQRRRTAQEEQESLAERISDVERTEDFQHLNSLAREKKEVDRKIETVTSEIKKREWEKEHFEKELNGFLREQVDFDSHRQKIENELNLVMKEAQQLRETHNRDQTRTEVYELDKALKKITDQEQEFQTFCNYNEIRLRDFEVDFDRRKVSEQVASKVCGYAYKLFKVKEGLAKAIEAGSGGSLYNIVVDDDKVSKELLLNRCFDRKVTFLPLNTIRPRSIRADRLAMAKEIARKYQSNLYYPASDDDCPAIDNKFRVVRDFVLGGYVICDNVEAANKIAYTPGCELVVVTTDGDVFDPSGLINGGYNHTPRASQFVKWLRYSKINEEVSSNDREKQRLRELRRNHDNNLQTFMANARKLETFDERINMLKRRYKEVDENSVAAMLEERKMQVEKSKRFLQNYREELAVLQKEKAELDARTSDYQEIQSKELMLKGLRERHGQISTKVKSIIKDYYQLEADRDQDTKEIAKKKEALVRCQQELARTEEAAIQKEKDTKDLASQIEEIERELEEKQEALRTLLASERDWKERQGKADSRLKQLEDSIAQAKSSQFKQEAALASAKLRWVDLQAQATSKGLTFAHGKEVSGLYNPLHDGQGNFEGWAEWVDDRMERYNNEEELNKYKRLKETVEEGAGRVNLQATQHKDQLRDRMALLEKQKEELTSNRKQIDNNKRHLDSKSVAAVLDCFQKVSTGFGTIFRGFLAGADAKMEPIYTNSVLTGIEIKVSFNGVWKASLGELSGGQRSLLALSFLLSLLQYKASPFYILDEVDAAMDLAHTENIGNVISRHFPQSQFLVISLKEAMHQQARVVYRTTVTDGQSKVVRYTQKVN